MQLITGLVSNNSAKVRIALAEKGVSYEAIEVPWTKAAAWTPKPKVLLSANPRAEVPVLIDGDLTLWDSTVINEYLEDKYPQPALMPQDPSEKVLCRLWEDEGDHNQSHVGVLIRDVFLAAPGAQASAAAGQAVEALDRFNDRLDIALANRDFLCGAQFTLADISVFLTLAFATTLGAEVRQTNVSAWFARVLERPTVSADFNAMMSAVASL